MKLAPVLMTAALFLTGAQVDSMAAPACSDSSSARQAKSANCFPSDAAILQMLQIRVDLQKQATGIVVGIVGPKGHRLIAYGTRGLTDKARVDGDTVYDVGSITKVFTALLLADMANRHQIAFDDPAGKYLPGVTLPARDGKQITLADLATHTSGLPLRPTNLGATDPANPYAGYTSDKLTAFLGSYTLPRSPGSQYEYSNIGYGLLGQVLSARGGESYPDLIRKRITRPLGMRDTSIEMSAGMKVRAATGYDSDLHPVPHWEMGALQSAGAFRSSANDLMRFLVAWIGVKKSPLNVPMNAMLAIRRPGGMSPASAISLAWNIFDDNGREIVWKNGSVGGFRAFIGFDRAAHLGVVALANAQTGNGTDDIGLHLLDPDYPVDLEVPRVHIEIALRADVLDRYVGRYRYSESDTLAVSRQGDHLFVVTAPGQPPLEIFSDGPNSFFLKVVNAQITFTDEKDGHTDKAIWHQSGSDQVGERIP